MDNFSVVSEDITNFNAYITETCILLWCKETLNDCIVKMEWNLLAHKAIVIGYTAFEEYKIKNFWIGKTGQLL